MPYSLKAVLAIAVVAVVSFIVAELAIPERSAVEAGDRAARERRDAQTGAPDSLGEDIPVVVAGSPPPPSGEAAAPKPAPAFDPRNRTGNVKFVNDKTAAALDAQPAKAEPIDAKAAKALDAKTVKAEPVDPKTAKALDTKTAAAPPQKTEAPAVQPVQSAAAAKPQPAEPPAAAQKKTTAASYRLEKAVLCSDIKNREPQGIANTFSKDAPYVYYFTHLVGARDSTAVIHKWYQNGKLIQTSILPVKSNYWRTHSRRNLLTHIGDVTGQWRVDVVEPETNKVMESASFAIE